MWQNQSFNVYLFKYNSKTKRRRRALVSLYPTDTEYVHSYVLEWCSCVQTNEATAYTVWIYRQNRMRTPKRDGHIVDDVVVVVVAAAAAAAAAVVFAAAQTLCVCCWVRFYSAVYSKAPCYCCYCCWCIVRMMPMPMPMPMPLHRSCCRYLMRACCYYYYGGCCCCRCGALCVFDSLVAALSLGLYKLLWDLAFIVEAHHPTDFFQNIDVSTWTSPVCMAWYQQSQS